MYMNLSHFVAVIVDVLPFVCFFASIFFTEAEQVVLSAAGTFIYHLLMFFTEDEAEAAAGPSTWRAIVVAEAWDRNSAPIVAFRRCSTGRNPPAPSRWKEPLRNPSYPRFASMTWTAVGRLRRWTARVCNKRIATFVWPPFASCAARWPRSLRWTGVGPATRSRSAVPNAAGSPVVARFLRRLRPTATRKSSFCPIPGARPSSSSGIGGNPRRSPNSSWKEPRLPLRDRVRSTVAKVSFEAPIVDVRRFSKPGNFPTATLSLLRSSSMVVVVVVEFPAGIHTHKHYIYVSIVSVIIVLYLRTC